MYEWPLEIPYEEYIRLYFLEKTLRQFVLISLSKLSNKWWKTRVPHDVRVQAEERKTEEEQRLKPTVNLHPIWYIDFYDYVKIITRKDNWNDIFKEIFVNKDEFKVTIMKLVPLRNKIAHMRPLSIREKKNLDALSEDVLAPIWHFYNKLYVEPAEKHVERREFNKAEHILKTGYDETGGDAWIAYKLGELYFMTGRLEEAKEWLTIASKYLPIPRYKEQAKQKLMQLDQRAKLATTKTCPKCGNTVPIDHNFCGVCGYRF